jgi:hypothetical protein
MADLELWHMTPLEARYHAGGMKMISPSACGLLAAIPTMGLFSVRRRHSNTPFRGLRGNPLCSYHLLLNKEYVLLSSEAMASWLEFHEFEHRTEGTTAFSRSSGNSLHEH